MGILLLTPVTHVKYQEDIFNMDYAEGYKKIRKNDTIKTLLYQGIVIELKHIYKLFACLVLGPLINNQESIIGQYHTPQGV